MIHGQRNTTLSKLIKRYNSFAHIKTNGNAPLDGTQQLPHPNQPEKMYRIHKNQNYYSECK